MAGPAERYDAIVVGSGAAGGWAAKELTERGARVLLLEAGPALDPKADFPDPEEGASRVAMLSRIGAVLGGQHVQGRCMSFTPQTQRYFVNDRQNPYTTAPGKPFNWYRARQVGGRLHLWGRNALRYSDNELHAGDRDDFGPVWPLDYADLAPWYSHVERFLGVHGAAEGVDNLPDGDYSAPHPLTGAEERARAAMKARWPDRPVTTCRIVAHNAGRIPLPLLAAERTGRLTLRADAVVSEVTVDPATGRATGVVFRDRITRETHRAEAKAVVLCASALESVRVLLNSRSEAHPAGIGGRTGNLGRYVTDKVMVFQAGPLEPLEPVGREDPYDFGAQSGLYVPSFRNVAGRTEAGFRRGYSLLGSLGRIEPGWFFMAIGEMLPRHENRIEIDPKKRDAWGIPSARMNVTHSDNERAMARDMQASLAEVADACGLKTDHLQRESILSKLAYKLAAPLVYTPEGALVPGSAAHETGGAIMGGEAATSVTNRDNQVWDAPNVFVTDAASFPTSPFQNPGLTIMALSARAGNAAADRLERGEFS